MYKDAVLNSLTFSLGIYLENLEVVQLVNV